MNMKFDAAPNDSRYTPLTQQDYCCVPTSVQMIMYRNNIPLLPAEEIGYHLGLTVSPEVSHLFYSARTSPEPPADWGYGTQISKDEFDMNKAFAHLQIPLKYHSRLASDIADESELTDALRAVEEANGDALLCFNHGVIDGEYRSYSGHVVVFDRMIDGKVRIVDASPRHPKWREVEVPLLFDAIQSHGDDNSGGIWFFEKIDP